MRLIRFFLGSIWKSVVGLILWSNPNNTENIPFHSPPLIFIQFHLFHKSSFFYFCGTILENKKSNVEEWSRSFPVHCSSRPPAALLRLGSVLREAGRSSCWGPGCGRRGWTSFPSVISMYNAATFRPQLESGACSLASVFWFDLILFLCMRCARDMLTCCWDQ